MLIATWIITFLIVVGIGIYAGTTIKSSAQWSGGDKSLSAVSLGAIFAAWQIGGMAIVGAAQNGYNLGIAGSWYSIAGSFYFIALAVFAKIIRNNMPGESVPVYLQSRFDTKTAKLYSYAWIVYGFLYIPIQLKTVSSIIQIVLPNINFMAAMIIGVTVAVVYTGFSGMKGASAVGRIVCIGIYILLIIFVVTTLPKFEGFSGLLAKLPQGYDSMKNMPLHRILGYLIAAPICFFTATCGMLAKASGADLGDGTSAFAYAIKTFTSPFFGGIIFAFVTMIIAATMATMMLATGTIITNVYKTDINPNADDKKVLSISKKITFIFAYLTLIPALFIPSRSLTNLFLTLQHVAAAPISFSILVGLTWKKVTKQGAFWSILCGMLVGIAWMVLRLSDKLEAIYPVVIVTYGVGIIVSLLTYKEGGK